MWKIPLFDVDFGPAELDAVQRPLKDGWLTMGPATAELEASFAALIGCRHAIAVTNATAALHLGLLASGLEAGDEVIVPALTFVASANAARYCGGRVVFGDVVGEHDLSMDPADVRRKITPKTKAIVAVHYAGYPARIEEIVAIAREHGLFIVEDCAHALVTELNGKRLGTFGRCGAFSFFSNKNMTCGEGGMVTTDDDEVARRLKLLRSHGMTTLSLDRHKGRAWSYDCIETGWNMRIDEIRARLASAQLQRLPEFLAGRENVRRWYVEALKDVPVTVPFIGIDGSGAGGIGGGAGIGGAGGDLKVGWHIMPVILPRGADREHVMETLKADGIQSSIHYPPAHRFTHAARENHPPLPVTEDLAARELTLPFYPKMTRDDVGLVCASLSRSLT